MGRLAGTRPAEHPNSSRSLVVGWLVGRLVGRKTFVKKLPFLKYKSNFCYLTINVVTVVTVLTVVTVVAVVTVVTVAAKKNNFQQ